MARERRAETGAFGISWGQRNIGDAAAGFARHAFGGAHVHQPAPFRGGFARVVLAG